MSAGCLLSARKLATSPRENGRIRSLFAGVDSGRNGAVCTLRPTSRLPRLTPDFPRFRSGFCSWISFADLINRVRIPVAPPNMEGQTPYVYPCGRYQLTGRNRPIAVIQLRAKKSLNSELRILSHCKKLLNNRHRFDLRPDFLAHLQFQAVP